MKAQAIIFTLLAAGGLVGRIRADLCGQGANEIEGNWFCQAVDAIRYSNVGTPGTYQQVTEISTDGTCTSSPKQFAGPIAPLDEEVSIHVRGPIQLKQFAVYIPSNATAATAAVKKDISRVYGHGHRRAHGRNNIAIKRDVAREMITATINGQVVSWANPATTPAASVPVEAGGSSEGMVTATIDGKVVSWENNYKPTSASFVLTTVKDVSTITTCSISGTTGSPAEPSSVATVGNLASVSVTDAKLSASLANTVDGNTQFSRLGYYDAASQMVDNLVFLGNYGGQGSGVFDYHNGASLSYLNAQGTGGSATPQILADATVPSGSEFAIMLGVKCDGDDCGYTRPGSVAYHGFGGAEKVFLFEFSMPMTGSTGWQGDEPAIWALNAQIPRTVQYGPAECSCWTSGCGEFDIAETLNPGSTYMKSTLHTNTPGGDSDYINRPTNGRLMKMAVIFSATSSTIHIQVLEDSTEFAQSLTGSDIDGLCSAVSANHVSLFAVSS